MHVTHPTSRTSISRSYKHIFRPGNRRRDLCHYAIETVISNINLNYKVELLLHIQSYCTDGLAEVLTVATPLSTSLCVVGSNLVLSTIYCSQSRCTLCPFYVYL